MISKGEQVNFRLKAALVDGHDISQVAILLCMRRVHECPQCALNLTATV